MRALQLFDTDKKYDNSLDVFVHKGVTYCFFLLSENSLPKAVLAYEEVVKPYRLFAAAICKHITEYGEVSSAKELTRDIQCMQFAECKGFQVVKICEQLCHIFIAM